MSTTEGEVVQDVAKKPITYKERDEEKRQKHPPLQEQAGPTRQESIDEVKRKLQDLGVDFTEIPENKLMNFYSDHFEKVERKRQKEKELVFADIECSIDDARKFSPNLICFEREASAVKCHIWGTSCIRKFLEKLLTWSQEKKSKKKSSRVPSLFP